MQRRAQSHKNKVTIPFLEIGRGIRSGLTQEGPTPSWSGITDYGFLIFSILIEKLGLDLEVGQGINQRIKVDIILALFKKKKTIELQI